MRGAELPELIEQGKQGLVQPGKGQIGLELRPGGPQHQGASLRCCVGRRVQQGRLTGAWLPEKQQRLPASPGPPGKRADQREFAAAPDQNLCHARPPVVQAVQQGQPRTIDRSLPGTIRPSCYTRECTPVVSGPQVPGHRPGVRRPRRGRTGHLTAGHRRAGTQAESFDRFPRSACRVMIAAGQIPGERDGHVVAVSSSSVRDGRRGVFATGSSSLPWITVS